MYDLRAQPSRTQNHQILSHNNGGATNFFAQKHDSSNYNSYSEGVLLFSPNHPQQAMETNHSGENSPPLWKNSPSHPLLRRHNYRSLSPNSRAQAIARGQWELMEMVKNMPESSYELSLKDLVEHQRVESQAEKLANSNKSLHQREVVKREGSKRNERNVIRSGNFGSKGLILNIVFPFPLKSKKKNKFRGNNTSGKVSPKPEGERDWWKKRFTRSSDDSENSRTSNSSSGGSRQSSYSGGRKSNGCLTGCWPFLHSREGKSVE